MNRYQFVQDAGHGWLKVSRAELDRLGLLNRISYCSYTTWSGSHIWLEEDCDLALFLSAIGAGPDWFDQHVTVRRVERSGVRSLNRYMA